MGASRSLGAHQKRGTWGGWRGERLAPPIGVHWPPIEGGHVPLAATDVARIAASYLSRMRILLGSALVLRAGCLALLFTAARRARPDPTHCAWQEHHASLPACGGLPAGAAASAARWASARMSFAAARRQVPGGLAVAGTDGQVGDAGLAGIASPSPARCQVLAPCRRAPVVLHTCQEPCLTRRRRRMWNRTLRATRASDEEGPRAASAWLRP